MEKTMPSLSFQGRGYLVTEFSAARYAQFWAKARSKFGPRLPPWVVLSPFLRHKCRWIPILGTHYFSQLVPESTGSPWCRAFPTSRENSTNCDFANSGKEYRFLTMKGVSTWLRLLLREESHTAAGQAHRGIIGSFRGGVGIPYQVFCW